MSDDEGVPGVAGQNPGEADALPHPELPGAPEEVVDKTGGLEDLIKELERLRTQVQQQDTWIRKNSDINKPVFVAAGRRLDRFRGKPERPTDCNVREWISDVRAQAQSRQLSDKDFAALLIENLGGAARQEILGRGESVQHNPEKIIQVLVRVFGEGDQLPQVQQKFYGYKQTDEDLICCSLQLVDIYDRMVELDPQIKGRREEDLKGRLAEAVRDEGLRRELRRLNTEQSTLSFFDLRDRAIAWMGGNTCTAKPRTAAIHEVTATNSTVSKQEELIKLQGAQIEKLLQALGRNSGSRKESEGKACWICKSPDHFKRQCPKWVGNSTTTPANFNQGN